MASGRGVAHDTRGDWTGWTAQRSGAVSDLISSSAVGVTSTLSVLFCSDRGSSSIITLVASTSAVKRAGERVQLAGAPVVMDADVDRIITRDGADISARAKALAEASSEFRQRRRGTACADGTRALVIASLAVVFVGALVGFVLHMYT